MNQNCDRYDAMEKRISRLEGERWILRGLLALAMAGVGIFIVAGFAGGADDKAGPGRFTQIDAGHIVLRDSDGQMRAWLGIAEGGPRLIFFDAAGQQRMGVGMTRLGDPALAVYDPGENPRVVIGIVEEWPGFVLRDTQGRKRVAIYSRDDWGSLYFYDRDEARRTGIGQFGEAAALNLCDEDGRDRLGLTTDRKGSSLSFFDSGRSKRIGLGLRAKDAPGMGFFDEEGQAVVSLTAPASAPVLKMYGTNKLEVSFGFEATNKLPRAEFLDPDRRPLWRVP